MRLSLLLLSVILSNFKNLIFPIDVGGCKLGTRKIDQHLYALGKLGVKIKVLGDKILLNREELKGTEINFDLQSTSATENALIACLNSKSTSVVITNAHLRPEILDFIHYLRKTGAKIEYNCDKSIIKVYPTSNFKPTIEHSIMGDLDEAFTYLVCAQLTHSKLKVDGFEPKFLQEELKVLERSGLKLNIEESSVTCTPVKDKDLKPFRINVGPYPKFSSDRNPIISALGSVISGQSKIVDRRFPERTQFHTELVKLGCDITSPKEGLNIIKGPSSRLTTSKVIATDIRGGAAMIILALRIQGETIIRDVYPITRGYENIELKLRKVGADIIKLN